MADAVGGLLSAALLALAGAAGAIAALGRSLLPQAGSEEGAFTAALLGTAALILAVAARRAGPGARLLAAVAGALGGAVVLVALGQTAWAVGRALLSNGHSLAL